MKILKVTKGSVAALWRDYGVDIKTIEPAWLSAFTASKIAKNADSESAEIVEVSTIDDAMAAVSGRKLARHPYPIVMAVPASTERPRGIASDIREGVDAWVFTSQQQADAWDFDLREKVVIPIADLTAANEMPAPHPTPFDEARTFTIIGDGGVLRNFARLHDAIDAIDSLESDDARLRICGTGTARYVMAEVRYARQIRHPERVVWLGEDFDIAKEVEGADIGIQAEAAVTASECAFLAAGKPLLEKLSADSTPVSPTLHSAEAMISAYKELYSRLR